MDLWFPKLYPTTTTPAPETSKILPPFEDEGMIDFNDFISESPDLASTEEEDSNENNLEKFNKIFKR